MKMPGFTAEAALFEAREYYHKTGTVVPDEGMIQPAFWGSCAAICQGDPDCIDCCICVRRGGKPSSCCF